MIRQRGCGCSSDSEVWAPGRIPSSILFPQRDQSLMAWVIRYLQSVLCELRSNRKHCQCESNCALHKQCRFLPVPPKLRIGLRTGTNGTQQSSGKPWQILKAALTTSDKYLGHLQMKLTSPTPLCASPKQNLGGWGECGKKMYCYPLWALRNNQRSRLFEKTIDIKKH